MSAIEAGELLAVWEEGIGAAPHQRALALLALTSEETEEELRLLPLGQRDARLLRFRERTFGRRIEGLADCPSCGATCEIAFRTTDIMAAAAAEREACGIRFRLPTSADLASAIGSDDPRGALLALCIEGPVDALAPEVIEAIEEAMERADPNAATRIEVTCPACAHAWVSLFDIGTFLWSEISAWGGRLLGEVHALATAYGWAERDILSMSAWRRRRYLELIGI
jgi:hypothetical protein